MARCDICMADIRKHHMARHRESKGHQKRAGIVYPVMDSDVAFTAFLASVRGANLTGHERHLYSIARSTYMGFGS